MILRVCILVNWKPKVPGSFNMYGSEGPEQLCYTPISPAHPCVQTAVADDIAENVIFNINDLELDGSVPELILDPDDEGVAETP